MTVATLGNTLFHSWREESCNKIYLLGKKCLIALLPRLLLFLKIFCFNFENFVSLKFALILCFIVSYSIIFFLSCLLDISLLLKSMKTQIIYILLHVSIFQY